jgi:hypothetical protein
LPLRRGSFQHTSGGACAGVPPSGVPKSGDHEGIKTMTDKVFSSDNYFSGMDGFDLPSDNYSVAVLANVLVGSVDQDGVATNHNNDLITNYGHIAGSGMRGGVNFLFVSSGTIINNAGGSILGGIGVEENLLHGNSKRVQSWCNLRVISRGDLCASNRKLFDYERRQYLWSPCRYL